MGTGQESGATRTVQLGQLAVQRGFVSEAQLHEALAARAREGAAPRPLGVVLVSLGFLTQEQLQTLLADQNSARPPGLRRLGKYALGRELGRGGMGVVFEALDGDLNRKVALKTMNPALEADPARGQMDHDRFVREARLTAQLKHPHIVSVYEAGVIDGHRYLAMELIEGQSMSRWWKAKGVGLPRKLKVLRDVALALQHAHSKTILHRDLKPDNVLVAADDHAFVTDFGLAKSMRGDTSLSITGAGLAVGTPAYMSPEQAQGSKTIDGRSDVYALGVILYEILTGQQPFRGETAIEILMKASKETPRLPSTAVLPALAAQDFDTALENVCLKALAKKPADRYSTAQAFADDLDRWLKGEDVAAVAPPSHTRRRLASLQESRRAPVWPWVAGGIAALALAAFLLAPSRKSPPLPDPAAGELARRARANEERLLAEVESLKSESRRREEELKKAALAAGAVGAAEREKAERELREFQDRARRAEAEALRLRTAPKDVDAPNPIPPPPPTPVQPPRPVPTPEGAWASAVPLLPLVEPTSDAVHGDWAFRDGALVSGSSATAQRLAIPYKPPAEYDLRVEVTRSKGSEIAVILSRAGRSFLFHAGSESSGFSEIAGKRAAANPTTVRPTLLESQRRHLLVFQVRKEGFAAFLDGRLLSFWMTDYADISMDAGWALPDASLLGLGAFDHPAAFHRVDVREISGPGLRVRGHRPLSREAEKKARAEATSRAADLKISRKGVKSPEDASALGRDHLKASAMAVDGGDFDLALRLAKDAGDIGRQARDAPLAADAAGRTAEIPDLRREYDKALKAEQALAANPSDDAAAGALGRWLCFFRDRWEEGLPLFARLSEAARREISREAPRDVGDAWFDAAEKEKSRDERRRLLTRAAFWYQRSEGCEKRIAAIEKETGVKAWIDLLRRLDPRKDPHNGRWEFTNGVLTGSSDDGWARYHLPYVPPAEYDLRLTLQRTDGRREFAVALPLENNLRVGVVMEGYDNMDTVGFEYIDGKDADEAPYTGTRAIFDDGKPHVILISVRRSRLAFASDGKPLIDTAFDPKKAKLDDSTYGPVEARHLILALNNSAYRCTEIQLLAISGPGRPLR